MKKMRRLLVRYVNAEIAKHNKGEKSREDWPEIDKEAEKSAEKLAEYLYKIETLALQRVEHQIANGNPDKPDKVLAALRKELSP